MAVLSHSLAPARTKVGRRVMANSSPSFLRFLLPLVPFNPSRLLAEILQELLLRPRSHLGVYSVRPEAKSVCRLCYRHLDGRGH